MDNVTNLFWEGGKDTLIIRADALKISFEVK
jgi:hypothetical protein